MLKTYNGFTHEQRMRGARIIDAAIANGTIEPPTKCNRCSQTEGELVYHVEDYSLEHILDNLEPLCRRCHDYVHRVSRPKEKQDAYWQAIKEGVIFPPQGKPRYPKPNKDSQTKAPARE